MVPKLQAQNLSREEINEIIRVMPSFSIHKDNYFITGVPTNTTINSQTADIKYQISFKQLITQNTLPWDTYLFLTYSQKAFWNVYEDSSPFQEINFNPSIGLGKAIYDKNDRVKGLASLLINHNSNGREGIYSRNWNSVNLKYTTSLNPRTLLSLEAWAPFSYKVENPNLLDYIGLGEVTFSYDFKPNKLLFEISAKKGLQSNWKGTLRSRVYYNPFKSPNQYLMLEWFAGYGESLIDYDKFTSMVRIGYVIKSNELDFLKSKSKVTKGKLLPKNEKRDKKKEQTAIPSSNRSK